MEKTVEKLTRGGFKVGNISKEDSKVLRVINKAYGTHKTIHRGRN